MSDTRLQTPTFGQEEWKYRSIRKRKRSSLLLSVNNECPPPIDRRATLQFDETDDSPTPKFLQQLQQQNPPSSPIAAATRSRPIDSWMQIINPSNVVSQHPKISRRSPLFPKFSVERAHHLSNPAQTTTIIPHRIVEDKSQQVSGQFDSPPLYHHSQHDRRNSQKIPQNLAEISVNSIQNSQQERVGGGVHESSQLSPNSKILPPLSTIKSSIQQEPTASTFSSSSPKKERRILIIKPVQIISSDSQTPQKISNGGQQNSTILTASTSPVKASSPIKKNRSHTFVFEAPPSNITTTRHSLQPTLSLMKTIVTQNNTFINDSHLVANNEGNKVSELVITESKTPIQSHGYFIESIEQRREQEQPFNSMNRLYRKSVTSGHIERKQSAEKELEGRTVESSVTTTATVTATTKKTSSAKESSPRNHCFREDHSVDNLSERSSFNGKIRQSDAQLSHHHCPRFSSRNDKTTSIDKSSLLHIKRWKKMKEFEILETSTHRSDVKESGYDTSNDESWSHFIPQNSIGGLVPHQMRARRKTAASLRVTASLDLCLNQVTSKKNSLASVSQSCREDVESMYNPASSSRKDKHNSFSTSSTQSSPSTSVSTEKICKKIQTIFQKQKDIYEHSSTMTVRNIPSHSHESRLLKQLYSALEELKGIPNSARLSSSRSLVD